MKDTGGLGCFKNIESRELKIEAKISDNCDSLHSAFNTRSGPKKGWQSVMCWALPCVHQHRIPDIGTMCDQQLVLCLTHMRFAKNNEDINTPQPGTVLPPTRSPPDSPDLAGVSTGKKMPSKSCNMCQETKENVPPALQSSILK